MTDSNTNDNEKFTTFSGTSQWQRPMIYKRNCPSFLRKTYTLINTCDPAIASWSEDGKSFVIKDQDSLSSKILHQFFKHNNLQSFIRQLNFYGFRKLRIESDITKPSSIQNEKILCYHHEMFVRGHPELLSKVRRPTEKAANTTQEVKSIRQDVNIIKENISALTKEMQGLKDVLKILARKVVGETNHTSNKNFPPRKKLKIDHSTFPSASGKVKQKSFVSSCDGQAKNIQKSSTNCSALNHRKLKDIWPDNLATKLNSFSLISGKCLNGTKYCDADTAHAKMSSSVNMCNNVGDKFGAIDSKKDNNLSVLPLISNLTENFNGKSQLSSVNLSNTMFKQMGEQLITNELRRNHLERVLNLQLETNKYPKRIRRRSSAANAA